MKKWITLVMLIVVYNSAQSQSLSDSTKISKYNKDWYLIHRGKLISIINIDKDNKNLIEKLKLDSILLSEGTNNINLLNKKIGEYEKLVNISDRTIESLSSVIKDRDKTIKNLKLRKTFELLGTGLVVGVTAFYIGRVF